MEEFEDYPEQFAKLFQPSFSFLSKINMKFFFKKKGFVTKYWRFVYIVPCLVFYYTTLAYSVADFVAQGQVYEVAYLLPVFLIGTQAILKFMLLFPKTSQLTTIIKELGALWRTTGLTKAQTNAREVILKRTRICNSVNYWVNVIGTCLYFTTPLLETLGRRFLLRQDCEMLLTLDCRYPFDPTGNWLVYGAVYAFQAYNTSLTVFLYIGAEMIMITLCAIVVVEFTLLCEDIMLHVEPESKKITGINRNLDNEVNSVQMFTIRDIVKRHQKLCVLSTQLDEIFNEMIFSNLMFVGLTTCFLLYAGKYSRGPFYMISYYVAMISCLLYILCECYYGELLTGASLRVGDAAYHSLWLKGDKQYKKTISIVIMRSQKPCCLTSLKYAPLTLKTFTKVMSSTWSYLSLINTMYEEENQ